MPNYQVLFNGEVAQDANPDVVRENLARELGLDDRKAKQLFSGRTVVVRSQLDQEEAQSWQHKLAELGAVCRIKNFAPRPDTATYAVDKKAAPDETLRDITAAHLECPRCGHMQLDSSHCARCGVNLEQAAKQKRKEDLLIEKKIRELRTKKIASPGFVIDADDDVPVTAKKGVLDWLKKKH